MSSGVPALELKAEDARKLVAAKCHLGSTNCNFQMKQYVYKRAPNGSHVIDINKLWQKIVLAARAVAGIENPKDICVVSTKTNGQRAILKFAKFIGTMSVTGRFSPGSFTNHSQAGYREPRLIIITDPTTDHQAVREASYVNIPVIALTDCDSALKYVDLAVPCNNRTPYSVGLIWWMICREVLRLRGTLSRAEEWSVMPDLFFYRDADEIRKQEENERTKKEEAEAQEPDENYVNDNAGENLDYWNEEKAEDELAPSAATAADTPAVTQDWSQDFQTQGGDWAATEQSSWS